MELGEIEKSKQKIAGAYNKWVKVKKFAEGKLVLKNIIPTRTKDTKYLKWLSN